MKIRVRREVAKQKTRSERRLEKVRRRKDSGKPVLSQEPVQHELGAKTRAIVHGGVGAVHQVAVRSGLIRELDQRLELLKYHRPYHEFDHVLNIAYNILCGGRTHDDIDLLRNDEVFLDALGVEARAPAPEGPQNRVIVGSCKLEGHQPQRWWKRRDGLLTGIFHWSCCW